MAGYEQLVINFLKMLEQRSSPGELDEYYHPEIEQVEFPNAITRHIITRDLAALKEASMKGGRLVVKERYEIKNLVSFSDTVLLECTWGGTLAIPVGKIAAGEMMVAHFAQIFEFKDGKIFRQRNYDCFEPFS